MGKLMTRLKKQLATDHKKDAEDCIKIYNKLMEMNNGCVWSSIWQPLVNVTFKGSPNTERTFKPSKVGYVFLQGIDNK